MKEKISDEKEEIAHLNKKIEKVDRLLEDKTTVNNFYYYNNHLSQRTSNCYSYI